MLTMAQKRCCVQHDPPHHQSVGHLLTLLQGFKSHRFRGKGATPDQMEKQLRAPSLPPKLQLNSDLTACH